MAGVGTSYEGFSEGVRAHFTHICDPEQHVHPRTLEAMIACAMAYLAATDQAEASEA